MQSMQSQQNKQNSLSKQETENYFNQIFQNQQNTLCFECGKKCKQWADKIHAIFFCLNCAALYKQITWAVDIKSITLDLWSPNDMKKLKIGGNRRFQTYLDRYELANLGYKDKLRTKAAEHYRIMLKEEVAGRQMPEAPSMQVGRQLIKPQIPLSDMSADEILSQVKDKALRFGRKTKEYGGKAIDKVQHKITSGQLKQDAIDAADKVSTNAKKLWNFLGEKIREIKPKKDEREPLRNTL